MPDMTKSEDHSVDSTDSCTLPEMENAKAIFRGRLVVGLILILAVIAVAVIVIQPPLSWKPASKVTVMYTLHQPVVNVVPGNQPYHLLRYAPISSPQRYHLEIQQIREEKCREEVPNEDAAIKADNEKHSAYTCKTEVILKTDVLMEPPARPRAENEFSFSLENVDVHVYNTSIDTEKLSTNDSPMVTNEIPLASVDDMLGNNKGDGKKGVTLFSALDDIHGMGSVIPDANINPQIARVLLMIADAIRMIYQPLPEQEIGDGASWDGTSGAETDSNQVKRSVKMTMDGETNILESRIVQMLSADSPLYHEDSQSMSGTSKVILRDGAVIQADARMGDTTSPLTVIHWEKITHDN